MKKDKIPSQSRIIPAPEGVVCSTWGASRRPMYRPTWAEIDRAAFTHNIKTISSRLKPGTRILAVVKANAYGHMAVPLSRLAVREGVSSLGVSSLEEGIALRDGGITAPILLLGSIYPLENLSVAREYKLIPTISSLQGLQDLARLGRKAGKAQPFHLKIDTGMCRIGISERTAPGVLEKIAAHAEVAMTGLYMHFAAADADPRFTRLQREKFSEVVRVARRLGLKFAAHAANSAALLRGREYHFDLVRPGISLYGLLPFDGAEKKLSLEPVLSWKTRVVFLKRVPKGTPVSYGGTFVTRRQSLIATLPVGYADGFDRSLSNRAEVLIRGQRCPVVGRVTMDMIMADVTAVKGAAIGDEAVLLGAQGAGRIRAEEMARLAGTINYEITCAIGARVPRVLV